MGLIKRNLLATFAGSGWMAALNFICVPIYVHFLGIEAYGLVGAFAALQAMLNVLDLGLSPTMNREMARYSALPSRAQEMRDLARSMETIYWSLGALIGLSIWLLAPMISSHWIKASHLPPETIRRTVVLMGGVAACQWPVSFYSGGLQGLQRQVLLNGINIFSATLRFGGAAFILWKVSDTIIAFFLWQIFSSAVYTLLLGAFFWSRLPPGERAALFQKEHLSSIRGFAGGMGAVTVVSLLLTQMDKVLLSRLLPMSLFGCYTLATVAASGLTLLISPMFSVLFPAFSALVAKGDEPELCRLYHRGCQLMSVIVLPAALVLALFSKEVLMVWIGNPDIVGKTHLIVSILVLGTALNGMMNLPYALQLAYGWTSLTFYCNLTAVLLLVPALILLTPRFGMAGAASLWAALNSGYFLIGIPLMHRRLLREEKWRWYFEDVAGPFAAALAVVLAGRLMFHPTAGPLAAIPGIAAISVAAVAAAAMTAPMVRKWAIEEISLRWGWAESAS